jgi:hypothetical protein
VNNRGVILVLLLLVAGLAAAGSALWHQYRQTHRALDYWGPDVARLIGHAPSVELTARPHGKSDSIPPDKMKSVPQALDISEARGLVHFRRSLLEDQNFDWDREPPDTAMAHWDYLVRFSDDTDRVVLAFDLDRRLVEAKEPQRAAAALTERMAEGLAQYFEETLAQADE